MLYIDASVDKEGNTSRLLQRFYLWSIIMQILPYQAEKY